MAKSLLTKGAEMLTRQLARGASPAGQLLYYPVDGGSTIDLTGKAWVGSTPITRQVENNGPTMVYEVRDYMIPKVLLCGEPKRGDRIVEAINGIRKEFEVMSPPLTNEPEWRWRDPTETVYRTHTMPQAC
jgi:hypothetical protein